MSVNGDELDETLKRTDERLDMMAWKMDTLQKEVVDSDNPELCVFQLMQSVTEVRTEYENLRRELVEVQAMQRELSGRLREQLQQVHCKFSVLKERLAAAPPPAH